MFVALATTSKGDIQNYLWVPLRMATCALNYATGGPLHEPFCSRVWRCWARGTSPRWVWTALYGTIDASFYFDPDHCWKQFVKTTKRGVPNMWSIAWLWQTF